MLRAVTQDATEEHSEDPVRLLLSPMDRIPVREQTFDLVVAHGIRKLARSAAEPGVHGLPQQEARRRERTCRAEETR
jgi:hypothetical protein